MADVKGRPAHYPHINRGQSASYASERLTPPLENGIGLQNGTNGVGDILAVLLLVV